MAHKKRRSRRASFSGISPAVIAVPGILGLLGVGAFIWWKKRQSSDALEAGSTQARLIEDRPPRASVAVVDGTTGSSMKVSPDVAAVKPATPAFFLQIKPVVPVAAQARADDEAGLENTEAQIARANATYEQQIREADERNLAARKAGRLGL